MDAESQRKAPMVKGAAIRLLFALLSKSSKALVHLFDRELPALRRLPPWPTLGYARPFGRRQAKAQRAGRGVELHAFKKRWKRNFSLKGRG